MTMYSDNCFFLHQAFCNSVKKRYNNFNQLSGDDKFAAERMLGVGGSDIPIIAGISPHSTPHELWLLKTGRTEPKDLSDNDFVYFGHVLEPVVRKVYEERTNSIVKTFSSPFIHKTFPWCRANIDGLVDHNDPKQKKIFEAKTASAFSATTSWGDSGTDQAPDAYILQVHFYMLVLGLERADIAVLIGGNDFRIYEVAFNKKLANLIIEKVNNFWLNHVLADIPPPALNANEVNKLFPDSIEKKLTATPDILKACKKLATAKKIQKNAEKQIQQSKNTIAGFLKKADTLTTPDKKIIATYKTQSRKYFNLQAFESANPDLADNFTDQRTSRILRFKDIN